MKNRKYLYSFLLLFLSMTQLFAQDSPILRCQQIIENFIKLDQIAYQVDYSLYDNLTSDQAMHTLQVDYRKLGDRMYIKYDVYEIYRDKKNYLQIDHENQEITQIPLNNKGRNFAAFDLSQLELLIKALDLKGKLYNTPNGHQGIRFSAPGKSKTLIELEYNSTNDQISNSLVILDLQPYENIEHEFDGKRIETRYHNYQSKNILFPYHFKDIIRPAGQHTKAIGRYAGYQIN